MTMKSAILLKVKLQGLDTFLFTIEDAKHDPKTGLMSVDIPLQSAISAASAADDSADEEGDPEEATDDDDGSVDEAGGLTTEELEGEDFDVPDVSCLMIMHASSASRCITVMMSLNTTPGYHPSSHLALSRHAMRNLL